MENKISKEKLQPVRGTKDLYGQEILSFNHIVETARNISKTYGFNELSTPIFEFSEIYERNLGETSDIISKEVYKFPDRGDNSLTLRPEFTAGVIRSLISNGELSQNIPQKLFSYGPVFRYDRPQKGRQRQFHQINFESIGQNHFLSDAEVIILAANILKDLKIFRKTELQVNTLGSENTKKIYQAALVEYFSRYENDLSNDSKTRLQKNPLRILDSKDAKDIEISRSAPLLQSFITVEEGDAFSKSMSCLTNMGINYQINPRLVRGLDYYTSTVFEFVTNDLGAQNTVLAGGRYDNLVSQMGGPNLPAVGFAAGIERLMLLLEPKNKAERPVFVVYVTQKEEVEASRLIFNLRDVGIYAQMIFGGNVKKQMKKAAEANAKYVIILGEEEVKNRELTVKNFDTGNEEKVQNHKIKKYLKSDIE
ncbi:MAG: histidyl-tRNA synthetase [Myxococcota bacterium]|jgi:histidyl-tRNA synthetase